MLLNELKSGGSKPEENDLIQPTKFGLVLAMPFANRNGDQTKGCRPVQPEWALALAVQSYPLNVNVQMMFIKGKEVGSARDAMVRQAMEIRAKYIFFLDDDVQIPSFAIRKLVYDLEQADEDVMAIGGIYTEKAFPPEPLVFRGKGMGSFWKWKVGEIFPVDGIAGGCLMVKMEVFDKISSPWFFTSDELLTSGSAARKYQTDDLYFCDKVRNAGYRILADGGILCVHWGPDGTPYELAPDSYPMRPKSDA